MSTEIPMQIHTAYYKRRYNRTLLPQLIPVIILVAMIGGIIFFVHKVTQKPTISPIAQAQEISSPEQIVPTPKVKDPQELKRRIVDALDDSIPQYSIVVDDFLHPIKIELGDQIIFEGASIHKIPILVAIAKEIQDGNLTWEETITFAEKDRQDYGTGSMRYQKSGGKYSIKELSQLMMEESDNTAAYILARRVLTFEKIQSHLENWGIMETSMIDNTTTNANMNFLFRQLFLGRILSAQSTREVIDYLDDSVYEDRLPALLPKEAKVYHKIGTAIAGLHDVGIVVTDDSMYYIGFFSKGVSDEERATKAIARVSKAVYDFMEE